MTKKTLVNDNHSINSILVERFSFARNIYLAYIYTLVELYTL